MKLAELIDLELQLAHDRSEPLERLRDRDAAIGRVLRRDGLDGRALYLAWIAALFPAGAQSPGRRIERLRVLIAFALVVAGLLSGAGAVSTWLAMRDGLPVNVVNFWPAIVGAQLVLLLFWTSRVLLLALPVAWRSGPLLRGPRAVQAALPGLIAWALSKLPGEEHALRVRELAELRKIDWLYGNLRFWIVASLTQGFALGFNVGALAALVIVPTVDDPAFGWRSRLLDADQLEAIAEVASSPWAHAVPVARLTPDEVRGTQYSSVDRALSDPRGLSESTLRDPWAAWWPFLVASLVAYGVVPRASLFVLAQLRVWRLREGARLDHADFERLRERLLRPDVETRARGAESEFPIAGGAAAALPEGLFDGSRPVTVLRWSGVDLEGSTLARHLRDHLGIEAECIRSVGGLDRAEDEEALGVLRGSEEPVALVVEAWEPPVADYLDFGRALRAALARDAPIAVLLYELREANPRHAAQWRTALGTLADPYLYVGRLPGRATP